MKKRNYPFEIACAVDQFLDEDGCPYSFDEENGCFKFDMIMPLAGKARDIDGMISVEKEAIYFYGTCPDCIDPGNTEMMEQMEKFICRINLSLENCSLNLNFNDGKIFYRASLDCITAIPTSEILENTILGIYDGYAFFGEGIYAILEGCSVVDALENCGDRTGKWL